MRPLILLLFLYQPLWPAISYITGFEVGSTGEFLSVTGTGATVQSTVKRTGTYALKIDGSTGTPSYVSIRSRQAGGTLRNIFRSIRFRFRVDTLPNAGGDEIIRSWDGTTAAWELIINTAGTFTIVGGAGSGGPTTSSNSLTANDGVWHLIQMDFGGTNQVLWVDGVNWASQTAGTGTFNQIRMGVGTGGSNPNGSPLHYFDDVIFDDASSVIADGQSILVLPTTDPGTLNSWTGGAGGTTNLWDAVNNIPPVGLAPASETNTSQIKNASAGSNLDYKPTTQSYSTAGVGSSDTINAVMAIVNDCEEVTTGTKAGGVWIDTNPAQAAGGNTFDYGDDTATVCGTFPTGWATHAGPISTSVTIGSTAIVAVRKTGSTTRVTDADFLAIYVDYLPNAGGTVLKDIISRGIIPFPR